MKRFGYARDPICLVACGLYAINRWVVTPRLTTPFLHQHFNDLLLIPAALPPVLWAQRRLGLRRHDALPDWLEVALHTAVWSIAAEALAPRLFPHATGDLRDVAAYAAGAVAAGAWWHWQRSRTRPRDASK